MPKRRAPPKSRAYPAELDEGVPTEEEWGTMLPFSSFSVDDEGKDTFKRNDVALLLPSFVTPEIAKDFEEHDFWVARIRDIRARRNTDEDSESRDVWVRVQWYYSAKDLAEVIKSFDATTCGKYERIFCDHYDYVHVDSFSGATSMTRIKDHEISQPYIGRAQFYCRYTYDFRERILEPRQKHTACPICSAPYSPDDSNPEQLMHFCPRPSCRKFYHEECLQKHRLGNSSASLQRIMTWPNTDDALSIVGLWSTIHMPMERPRKRRAKDGHGMVPLPDSASEESCNITMDFLDSLPNPLVKVAEQPIVRGAAFVKGGVSGNVAPVTQARQMIYDVLQGSSVPESWQETIDVSSAIVTLRMGSKKRNVNNVFCPNCQSAI